MEPALIGLLVFTTIFLGGMALLRRAPEQEAVGARLLEIEHQRSPRAMLLTVPYHRRVLLPVLKSIVGAAANLLPPNSIGEAQKRLVMAGRRTANPVLWILRKWAQAGVAGALVYLAAGHFRLPALTQILVALGAGGWVYLWPEVQVRSAILERQNKIVKELPETLDLLTISVEAGLGLDQALETVTAKRAGPLSDEIRAYLEEVRLGRDRQEALRAIGSRTGVEDLISLAATLTQAMEFGVSIGLVLRIQADAVRTRRRQRIEEHAMKAPVKMLFPLIFLILPALFVVVAGPGLIRAYEEFVKPTGPSQFRPPAQQIRR